MTDENICPRCHNPLPPGSPKGACRKCLLKQGLSPDTIGYTADDHATWTPPAVEQLQPVFPELDILELIGRGGMGAVYKARQKELDRLVALKILPPEIGRQESFAQRFAREAQAMARLSHPNIVTIHDFGQKNEYYFFLMEYVDGLNLRQLLNAGTVSPKEALAIVPQICDALQYAHDRGIVHRDIKPENILLNRQGQVKIADFGLAKLVGHGMGSLPVRVPPVEEEPGRGQNANETHGQDARATHGQDVHATESVMGTPQYMAPEQVERPAEVDHRADIYSLGVVFYQMLTGELPSGRPGETFEPPSRKLVIDVRLDEVVLRALEKEPSRRYQQASQVRTEVETIVATPPGAPSGTSQDTTAVPGLRGPQGQAGPTPPSAPTANVGKAPRLSRMALVGAICAAVGFPGILHIFDIALVPVPGLAPGALIAATACGIVALVNIRRSQGRLRGLGLALFDSMLLPLLVLDGLVGWGISSVLDLLLKPLLRSGVWTREEYKTADHLCDILIVVLCLLIDFLIVLWAWRAAKRPVNHAELPPDSVQAPSSP